MTTEHNSPTGEAEAVRLAEKHQADRGDIIHYTGPLYRFTPAGLAALIADVRRDEREKCAQELHEVGPNAGPYAYYIRARLEEGK
jgi:hypothetical protein